MAIMRPSSGSGAVCIANISALISIWLRNSFSDCWAPIACALAFSALFRSASAVARASSAVEGAQVPFDVATRIESRYFVELVTGQVAKNMIGTFFFQLNEIKGGAAPKRRTALEGNQSRRTRRGHDGQRHCLRERGARHPDRAERCNDRAGRTG